MPEQHVSTKDLAGHWDSAYVTRGTDGVSWYQADPLVSLELVARLGIRSDAAVIDVGGGGSLFADRLVGQGFSNITVLDISGRALADGRRRLGDAAPVSRIQQDVLTWSPTRRYDLWHDRALLHFLTTKADRDAYLRALSSAITPGGLVIVAAFSPDGPAQCSGLPVRRYSTQNLTELLGEQFEPLESLGEEHRTPGGGLQSFIWLAGRMRPDEGESVRS